MGFARQSSFGRPVPRLCMHSGFARRCCHPLAQTRRQRRMGLLRPAYRRRRTLRVRRLHAWRQHSGGCQARATRAGSCTARACGRWATAGGRGALSGQRCGHPVRRRPPSCRSRARGAGTQWRAAAMVAAERSSVPRRSGRSGFAGLATWFAYAASTRSGCQRQGVVELYVGHLPCAPEFRGCAAGRAGFAQTANPLVPCQQGCGLVSGAT